MKKIVFVMFIAGAVIAESVIAQNISKIPEGWFPAGSSPAQYEMGIDKSASQSGKACATVKSKNPGENDFGTLMQTISAENFIGKRLQLSGYIKSKDVKGWSGIWMRIDGENNQQLGFDNMKGRAVRGTTDWKKYMIVLDVPAGSKTLNFGLLLGGQGKVWFDNLKMEEVDKTIKVTNLMQENKLPSKPVNLDFEK
jgi:hypothetical protein